MEIIPLIDHLDAVPVLAKWFYREWRDLISEETLEEYAQKVRGFARRDGVPMAFVVDGGSGVKISTSGWAGTFTNA